MTFVRCASHSARIRTAKLAFRNRMITSAFENFPIKRFAEKLFRREYRILRSFSRQGEMISCRGVQINQCISNLVRINGHSLHINTCTFDGTNRRYRIDRTKLVSFYSNAKALEDPWCQEPVVAQNVAPQHLQQRRYIGHLHHVTWHSIVFKVPPEHIWLGAYHSKKRMVHWQRKMQQADKDNQ